MICYCVDCLTRRAEGQPGRHDTPREHAPSSHPARGEIRPVRDDFVAEVQQLLDVGRDLAIRAEAHGLDIADIIRSARGEGHVHAEECATNFGLADAPFDDDDADDDFHRAMTRCDCDFMCIVFEPLERPEDVGSVVFAIESEDESSYSDDDQADE